MKTVRLLLTCLICAGVGAGQGAPARKGAPPDLSVLKLKWERQLEVTRDGERSAVDASRGAGDTEGHNNPGGIPTAPRAQFPPYVYHYAVEVRNDGARGIKWLSWEYVLSDPPSKKELGRHKFVSFEKINPAKKKTLRGRTRSAPVSVVSAEALGKGKQPVYDERVEFRCAAYEDGTLWRHPAATESECEEAGKRKQ